MLPSSRSKTSLDPSTMAEVERRHAGYDWGPMNTDALGKTYLIVAGLCTLVLALGITGLLYYRQLHFIRIRNLTLMISSVCALHVYLIIVFLVYPLNGSFPCSLGFWVMNTYLPFGVALFQAQNMQLLSLSVLQKQLVLQPSNLMSKSSRARRSFAGYKARWLELSLLHKTYFFVSIGIVMQSCLVLIIYLSSRKFHSFGITSKAGDAASCRRGWEWIPSALWQGLWSFGFGPWLLFRIRKITDTHRWTLQTSLAIASGLPALPLWLAALYSPAFAPVNHWWTPDMWYAPSLITMEFVTVFFPLLEVYESKRDRKSTSAAIAEWEEGRHGVGSLQSVLLSNGSTDDAESQKKKSMLNMQALERALEFHARELLEFAATKQFTGENIVFLTRVRAWKERWNQAALVNTPMPTKTRTKLYEAAKEIFDRNISLYTSQFPVNLESRFYQDLDRIFGSNLPSIPGSIITPFTDLWEKSGRRDNTAGFEDITQLDDCGAKPDMYEEMQAMQHGFSGTVFDQAERSVKYMVFTNTWPRYLETLDSPRTSSS